ncbi:MAG: FHA domain-containing protein [Anaerolineales bacterium]|jgi:predicted component of type VI protein secretion system
MPGQYQLTMRSGPNPGTVYALDSDQISIGRDSSSEITVNDAEVSRRHSRLTFQGGKYVLEDLGSTNGTFVNGQRLTGPHVLKSGEVISLGEQIVFVYEAVESDPGATMISPRSTAAPRPVTTPPPAPQAYAGQVPAGQPEEVAPPKKINPVPIAIGVGVLLLICVCIAFFVWVDQTYRWCVFFPFIPGCG